MKIFINLCFWLVFYCRVSSNVYNFVLCFVQSEFFTTDKLNAKMRIKSKAGGASILPRVSKAILTSYYNYHDE